MSALHDAHIAAVEAVNNAKTEAEHRDSERFLRGFRSALEAHCGDRGGYGGRLMDCDLHYINQGVDRPMCCGVFLDWEPA